MKTGSPTAKLFDLSQVFADGDWIESKDQSARGIRLIQTGNVGAGSFKNREHKARYVSRATFERLRCTEVFEGDCLISRLPEPVGRSCIVPQIGERMITAVDCTIVRFDEKRILPRFFSYYSRCDDYLNAVQRLTTGTTRNRISRSKLGEILVPIPPIGEQRRIVEILDKAFAGIAIAKANAETNLENAQTLYMSQLDDFFGSAPSDECFPIGDVAEIFDGPHATPKTVDAGPVFLGISALQDGSVNLDETRHVTEKDFKIWTRRVRPEANDVVFSYETRLGQAAIIPDGLECCLGRRMGLVRVSQARLKPLFFLYQYLAPRFQRFLCEKTVKGATVDRISIKDFPSFRVWVPGVEEQLSIVERIQGVRDRIGQLTTIYARKLNALEELELSLLQAAFDGRI